MSRKMDKQTAFSVFVAIIMITSVASFALSQQDNANAQQGFKIESVYDRPLTSQEKVSILRTGRTIIEHMHLGSFDDKEKTIAYKELIVIFGDFLILEDVEITDTEFVTDQMITPNGDMVDLSNVSSEKLFDTFCDNSVAQPKECLLKDF